MIPTIVLFLHSFCNHHHHICDSKVESHIHQKEIECKLHLLHHNTFYFSDSIYNFINYTKIISVESLTNNFLKNHQQLSFSLRGPPLKVQV
jgi:hypothetical protein